MIAGVSKIQIAIDGFYKVSVRRGADWPDVKPEAELVDGKVYYFTFLWEIEDGIYKGEFAMQSNETAYPRKAPAWIASGDLEFQPI